MHLILAQLRWRTAASLAVFALAVVAVTAAALGPLYAHSAQESLLKDALEQADPVSTGLLMSGDFAGQTQFSAADIDAEISRKIATPEVQQFYRSPIHSMTVPSTAVTHADAVMLGLASIGWYDAQCTGVRIISGRCPEHVGEAMVSSREFQGRHLHLSEKISALMSTDDRLNTVRIVGTYDVNSGGPRVWGIDSPAQSVAAVIPGQPDRLDEVLVSRDQLARAPLNTTVSAFLPLNPSIVSLDDVTAVEDNITTLAQPPSTSATSDKASPEDSIATLDQAPSGSARPSLAVTSRIADVIATTNAQRAIAWQAAVAVTVQLVALALFVLFLAVAAASEERSPEIALAKLRGFSPSRTAWFGLGPLILLLVAAVPVGVLAALALNRVLVTTMAPGTSTQFDAGALVSVGITVVGGAVAIALAGRSMLATPVLQHLRRTGSGRFRRAGGIVLETMVLTLAAVSLVQLWQRKVDGIALLAPALVGFAAATLALHVTPGVFNRAVQHSRRSSDVARFLAARSLARRPGAGRLLVLITMTMALAVFAVDVSSVVTRARSDLARVQVGAGTVLHVQAASPTRLLDAVRAVDPDGRFAMAATQTHDATTGGQLAVDTLALPNVSVWDPQWAGLTWPRLTALISPPVQQPVLISRQLSLTTQWTAASGGHDVTLRADLVDPDGSSIQEPLGTLRPGTQTFDASLPGCVPGCRLDSLWIVTDPAASGSLKAQLQISSMSDAAGPVPGFADPGRWRSGPPLGSDTDPTTRQPVVVTARSGTLVVEFHGAAAAGSIEVADHPVWLPVVAAAQPALAPYAPGGLVKANDQWGNDSVVRLVHRGKTLPYLGSSGLLADLTNASRSAPNGVNPPDLQVWLSPDAPVTAVQQLGDHGVTVVATETLAARSAILARGAASLALRLFLVAAGFALVLALVGLVTVSAVAAHQRRYELTALWSLGTPRGTLAAAGRRERAVVLGLGLLLGSVVGLGAAQLVVRALGALTGGAAAPASYGPGWLAVVLLVAGFAVVLALVVTVSARRSVRGIDADVLREGPA